MGDLCHYLFTHANVVPEDERKDGKFENSGLSAKELGQGDLLARTTEELDQISKRKQCVEGAQGY